MTREQRFTASHLGDLFVYWEVETQQYRAVCPMCDLRSWVASTKKSVVAMAKAGHQEMASRFFVEMKQGDSETPSLFEGVTA
jgi:hypothetical protein